MADEEKDVKKGREYNSRAKSFRKSEEARITHKSHRNELSTAEKKLRAAVASKDETAAAALLKEQYSLLDKSVKYGTCHKNKASRKKSRLASLVSGMKATEAKAE